MASLAIPAETRALLDEVARALERRGPRHPAPVEKEALRLAVDDYGGTSEIQRSIIAESALGLPRSR